MKNLNNIIRGDILLYLKNKGIQNENDFINYFENKKIKDLNPIAYDFIMMLFPEVTNDDIIKTTYRFDKTKSDFLLTINNTTKRISVKNGRCNSVHLESIETFVDFLRNNEISNDIIQKFLYYHYADSTTDGSGKNRLSVSEFKLLNQKSIDLINVAFNNEKLLIKAIDRFLLEGKFYDSVDVIIYGTIDDFLWITKNEIYNLILSKKDMYSTGVHFGPLFCQPWTRNLQFKESDEYKRNYIQIKWYSLMDDIIEMMILRKK